MNLTKLIPNIFYEDIKVGLATFVDCLGFTISYNDLDSARPCCVIDKGNLSIFLFEDKEYADKDRPEIRFHTDDIEKTYAEVSATYPALLHPNLKKVTLRPWGAKEFALADPSGVCIIIQQWT